MGEPHTSVLNPGVHPGVLSWARPTLGASVGVWVGFTIDLIYLTLALSTHRYFFIEPLICTRHYFRGYVRGFRRTCCERRASRGTHAGRLLFRGPPFQVWSLVSLGAPTPLSAGGRLPFRRTDCPHKGEESLRTGACPPATSVGAPTRRAPP